MPIFTDPSDFAFFISLFARYLSREPAKDKSGTSYPHYAPELQLLSFCLMRNHFHLLLYQSAQGTMPAFMRSIMTSYSRYFNFANKRSGPLFESRYKASMITDQSYLEHISRYIHLNPRYWKRYPYSSFKYYKRPDEPEWITPSLILRMFNNREEYIQFMADYENHKLVLEQIKHTLANT